MIMVFLTIVGMLIAWSILTLRDKHNKLIKLKKEIDNELAQLNQYNKPKRRRNVHQVWGKHDGSNNQDTIPTHQDNQQK